MNFTQAIASGFQNYVNFTGRAARSEYWFWTLFTIIVSIAASLIDLALFAGAAVSPLNSLASLAMLLPSLAVSARRFHDMDRTGWWLLLLLTGIGVIIILIWFCFKGTTGSNRFGPDPLAGMP
jgi:uncharacterized membrane protein YhaH (DUF805 family)